MEKSGRSHKDAVDGIYGDSIKTSAIDNTEPLYGETYRMAAQPKQNVQAVGRRTVFGPGSETNTVRIQLHSIQFTGRDVRKTGISMVLMNPQQSRRSRVPLLSSCSSPIYIVATLGARGLGLASAAS